MSKWLRSGLAAILILLWVAPVQVSAYSYGDANTEDVAETFKLIEASLSGSSPDWKAAEAAHKVRRSEIKSHFGDAVAVTLDKNVEAKESKLLVANYKAVLVMNLDRRFTYALKDVNDYAGAKLLLAKAKATFDTMAPYIGSGTDDMNAAFDEALDALGNPGLFGVGKKEVDPETFKKKVDFIYAKVKPLFPYKAYVKPAVTEPTTPSPKPSPSTKPSPDKEAVASPEASPDAKPSAKPADETSEPATPSASASPEPTEQASASPEPSASAEATESAAAASEEAEPAASEASEPDPSESAAASADPGEPAQEAGATPEGHAPMERSDKTNTWITVLVIGGVIIVGGGALWFIRKKGLI